MLVRLRHPNFRFRHSYASESGRHANRCSQSGRAIDAAKVFFVRCGSCGSLGLSRVLLLRSSYSSYASSCWLSDQSRSILKPSAVGRRGFMRSSCSVQSSSCTDSFSFFISSDFIGSIGMEPIDSSCSFSCDYSSWWRERFKRSSLLCGLLLHRHGADRFFKPLAC